MSTTHEEAASGVTFADLLERRHSCRGFAPTPVPRETIEQMLLLAQQAPSWCNTQPWRVIVTEGAGTEVLRDRATTYMMENAPQPDIAFPETYVDEADARRKACAWQLYESVGIAKGDRQASGLQALENFKFFGAPHVLIITTDSRLGPYGGVDCGVYLGNLLLAAQSLGLATIPQAALAAVTPVIRELYDVPEHRDVLCGVSFGYEAAEHPANGFRTERAGLEDVVTWVGD